MKTGTANLFVLLIIQAQMISGKIRRAGMLPESVAEVLAVAPGSLLRETPFKKIEGRHDSDDARI
ncbi:MAG: hypothetical protein IPJ33_07390 [Gammaproteobacteria bacterium]|nr:hypothetical protein [Gammaproteobacteria bacterium]MBK7728306.1 hypothetical protein [Gammaproteobacteria bacterium]MBK8308398.1 hypothetical protein [Gammaproteobacteria bacterium]